MANSVALHTLLVVLFVHAPGRLMILTAVLLLCLLVLVKVFDVESADRTTEAPPV